MFKKKWIFWTVAGIILFFILLSVSVPQYYKPGSKASSRALQNTWGTVKSPAGWGLDKGTNTTAVKFPVIRKLIKKAEINLEVKNCEETSQKIINLANNFSGIIIDSTISKYPEQSRSGATILKVPPKNFDTVLLKIKELGKVELEKVTGEDVTEEYIDLEARLKNAEVVRNRLVKILDEKAREVKDILEVEREITRIGETIEQTKGRMKYVDQQVNLASITVNYYEFKTVVPESLNVVRKFKESIRTSISVFIDVFNGAIVVIAALLPVVIWLSIIIALIFTIKKMFRNKPE